MMQPRGPKSSVHDIKIDMPVDTILPAPPSPFHRSSLRKLRRRIRSTNRRHLAIISLFVFISLVCFHSVRRYGASSSSAPTSLFGCPSNRTNPGPVPTIPSKAHHRLTETWSALHKLFAGHPPHPSTLPQPKHESDLGFPTKEQLKHLLNISDSEAHLTRIEHTAVLRHIVPYPEDVFQGRGIVTLAGGRYSEFAAIALGMLREVGSRLPVEVWVKDRSEENKNWCDEIEKEGMICRRLSDYIDLSAVPLPYQWKAFVMLFSSFEEILFLDADSIPIKNPDAVFESKVYHDTGAVLWPDYWKHTGSPWLPYAIGISDGASEMLQDERSVESGQIVWNKHRHWKSLCLATYYNYYGPKYYYSFISQGWAGWGDKDTFPMALKACKEPYHQITHDITTVFVSGTLLGIGMVQSSPANLTHPEPLFLHSNIVKWSVGEFLCVGCPSRGTAVGSISALENPQSPINSHLKEGKRIFSTNQLAEVGIDPEPLLWRCMENTACRSVWGNPQLCAQTRSHMKKTFGFQFRSSRFMSLIGYGDRVCVVDP